MRIHEQWWPVVDALLPILYTLEKQCKSCGCRTPEAEVWQHAAGCAYGALHRQILDSLAKYPRMADFHEMV